MSASVNFLTEIVVICSRSEPETLSVFIQASYNTLEMRAGKVNAPLS